MWKIILKCDNLKSEGLTSVKVWKQRGNVFSAWHPDPAGSHQMRLFGMIIEFVICLFYCNFADRHSNRILFNNINLN